MAFFFCVESKIGRRELIQLVGLDPEESFLLGDQFLPNHIDRDLGLAANAVRFPTRHCNI